MASSLLEASSYPVQRTMTSIVLMIVAMRKNLSYDKLLFVLLGDVLRIR